MTGRRASQFERTAAFTVAVSAPGLIAVALFAAWGILSPRLSVILGVVILAPAALVFGRLIRNLAIVHEAVEIFSNGEPTALGLSRQIVRRLDPTARELWFAIERLTRVWRERLGTTEERLAAAEAVMAAVPNPLILLDERRRIVRANAQAAEFVGGSSEARDLAAALRNPNVLGAADAVLRGEPARVVDFTVTVPIERHLRARFARLTSPALDGAVAILTLHDITELKRAEQMRADFIANASHELRTPLSTLAGFIETLRGPAREDPDARDRFLAIMQQQSSRMARLVEDLLSLSRIELNEHVMPTGRVRLAPLLHQITEALELRAGERDMRIRVEAPAGLPEVLGDRDELAQVFQNLVDNAIKYGRSGSEITVSAEMVSRPRHAGDSGIGGFVSIAVRDYGEGITREHLPRLTERFYRVDTARSREMGGTGLGLAIVKHILNHHRGSLEIESTPGVGSVFTVLLRACPVGDPDCTVIERQQNRHRTCAMNR
ncbi:MAG TPA: ATP-binding protein [Stellaceae bacterium]|nr:ATP-binding protein [Stellaceae bacterium]